MTMTLKRVTVDEKEILKNLLEKYDYEFSQWSQRDVNALGLFGYDYLDYYWVEPNRYAYFILVDQHLAGFVMVNDYPEVHDQETDFQLAEFFVLFKYRRSGVGKAAFFQVLDLHSGRWQLKCHPKNEVSVLFWHASIDAYTNGRYTCIENYERTAYEDGTLGHVFFFDNRKAGI